MDDFTTPQKESKNISIPLVHTVYFSKNGFYHIKKLITLMYVQEFIFATILILIN